MTQLKYIKVIAIDGQPYGRPLRPYSKFLTIDECKDFEAYANQHQHPFPGATIGDVIEADKVEVVKQYSAYGIANNYWTDEVLTGQYNHGERVIYRIKI